MPSQQQVSSSLSWPIGARSTRLTWEKLGSHDFFEGIAHTLAEVCLQLFTSNDNVSYFSSLLELLSLIFQFNQTSLFWNISTYHGCGFSSINMTSPLNDSNSFLEIYVMPIFSVPNLPTTTFYQWKHLQISKNLLHKWKCYSCAMSIPIIKWWLCISTDGRKPPWVWQATIFLPPSGVLSLLYTHITKYQTSWHELKR